MGGVGRDTRHAVGVGHDLRQSAQAALVVNLDRKVLVEHGGLCLQQPRGVGMGRDWAGRATTARRGNRGGHGWVWLGMKLGEGWGLGKGRSTSFSESSVRLV